MRISVLYNEATESFRTKGAKVEITKGLAIVLLRLDLLLYATVTRQLVCFSGPLGLRKVRDMIVCTPPRVEIMRARKQASVHESYMMYLFAKNFRASC